MDDIVPRPPARSDNAPTVGEMLEVAVRRHRALAVLRLLAGPLKGGGNDRLLSGLLEVIGLRTSRAALEATIRDLERLGALDVETREGLLVMVLRSLGAELAGGVEVRDEVERPGTDFPARARRLAGCDLWGSAP